MLRHVITTVMVAAGVGVASPLAAETVTECQDRVIMMCADALEEASWWEKPAVGALCTGMLAGCTGHLLHA